MNTLEYVADAIMKFEGWSPGTRSYRNRNPGNLRGGLLVDKEGYNIYPYLTLGYQALVTDLEAKFNGHNSHKLGQKSTLQQLMEVYAPSSDNNPTNAYTKFIAAWLTKCLDKPITPDSKLEEIWQTGSS